MKEKKIFERIHFFIFSVMMVWLFAGMIWMPQGNKPLAALAIVCLIFSIPVFVSRSKNFSFYFSGWSKLVLFLAVLYSLFYFFHGGSSQEVRAIWTALVILIVSQVYKIELKDIQYLVLISALSSGFMMLYYVLFLDAGRMDLPTNPIPLATHQSFLSIISLSLLFYNFKGKSHSVIIFSFLLFFASVLLTQSRGPISVTMILAIFIFYILVYMRKVPFRVGVGFVIIFFSMVGFNFDDLLVRYYATINEWGMLRDGNLDSSMGWRFQMYFAGWEIFKSNPWLGVGTISSVDVENINLTREGMIYVTNGHLHNNYIDKLATSGLLGFSALLALFLYPVYEAFRESTGFKLLIIFPIICWSLCSLIDSPFRNGDTAVLYFVVIGFLLKSVRLENENSILSKTSSS